MRFYQRFGIFFLLIDIIVLHFAPSILRAYNINGNYPYIILAVVLITLQMLPAFLPEHIFEGKSRRRFSLTFFVMRICLIVIMRICLIVMRIFSPKAKYYIYLGNFYRLQKKYDLGLETLTRSIELAPKAESYTSRGMTYRLMKQYAQALQDFEQALHYDPHYAQAYFGKAIVYHELKNFAQALENYDLALKHVSHKRHKRLICNTYEWRGVTYQCMEEHRQALNDFQSSLALFPRNVRVYNWCARSYIMLQEYGPAVRACTRAIWYQPNNGCTYDNRGVAYLGLNNLEQAMDDFRRGSRLHPAHINHTWHVEWARFCLEKPDDEAAKRLDALAQIDTRHKITWVCKGVAHWIRGASEEAVHEFDRSIQFEPIQWDAYFWKAIACATLQRDEEAKEALQAALANSMPPILLSPLRWLEEERPDFYQQFVSSV